MYKRKVEGSWIDQFVKLGEGTESPVLYYRWCALIFMACALRRKVFIQRPRYRDYPNLYVILVSPPGCTRKSTAADFGYNSVVRYVPAIRKFTGRITTEALCSKLQKVDVAENNAGGVSLVSDASLFLYASELSSLFKKLPRGSYPVIDFLTAVYGSGGEFTYETKSGGEVALKEICINLLAATTVNGVNELIGHDGIECGFTSRTIFVYQDVRMPRAWMEEDFRNNDKIQNLIDDLVHISSIVGEMEVPAMSKRWFDNWYIPQAMDNPPPELIHYWSRRHDHLLKVAMLYALSERDELVLRIEDLEKAKDVIEEVEKFMPYAFLGVDKTKESCIRELVLSFIREQGGEVTYSQVLRKFQHKLKSSKELRDIMAGLVEGNIVNVINLTKSKGMKYIIQKELV